MRDAGQLCAASVSLPGVLAVVPSTPTAGGLSALRDFSCWLSQWGLRSGRSPPKLELSTEHVVLKTTVNSQPDCFFQSLLHKIF